MSQRIFNRSTLKVSVKAKQLLLLMFQSDGEVRYVFDDQVFLVGGTRLGPARLSEWAEAVMELAYMQLVERKHNGRYILTLAGGKAAMMFDAAMRIEIEEAFAASGATALS